MAEQGFFTVTQQHVSAKLASVTPSVPPAFGTATRRRNAGNAVLVAELLVTPIGNDLAISLPSGSVVAGDTVCWVSYS